MQARTVIQTGLRKVKESGNYDKSFFSFFSKKTTLPSNFLVHLDCQ